MLLSTSTPTALGKREEKRVRCLIFSATWMKLDTQLLKFQGHAKSRVHFSLCSSNRYFEYRMYRKTTMHFYRIAMLKRMNLLYLCSMSLRSLRNWKHANGKIFSEIFRFPDTIATLLCRFSVGCIVCTIKFCA